MGSHVSLPSFRFGHLTRKSDSASLTSPGRKWTYFMLYTLWMLALHYAPPKGHLLSFLCHECLIFTMYYMPGTKQYFGAQIGALRCSWDGETYFIYVQFMFLIAVLMSQTWKGRQSSSQRLFIIALLFIALAIAFVYISTFSYLKGLDSAPKKSYIPLQKDCIELL